MNKTTSYKFNYLALTLMVLFLVGMFLVDVLPLNCTCNHDDSIHNNIECTHCGFCYDNHSHENGIVQPCTDCESCILLMELSEENTQYLQMNLQSSVSFLSCVVLILSVLLRPQNFYPKISYKNIDYDVPISGRKILLSSSLLLI